MRSISGMIADTLWNQGIIQKEDIDKCRYGLDVFISSALEVASILAVSYTHLDVYKRQHFR